MAKRKASGDGADAAKRRKKGQLCLGQTQDIRCTVRATFGLPGGKAQYCKNHKEPDMVDVKNKKCEADDCTAQPNFGLPGGKAQYCKNHKKPGMVDVKHEKCEADDCTAQPNFGLPGGKAQYCKNHKKPGMVDVKHEKCEEDDCTARPTFGPPGGKAQYCKNHKKPGMIDVISKKCEKDDCISHPSFGLPGGKAQYCKNHKKPDMVDVRSKTCEADDCTARPNFGLPGGKAQYCKNHKKPGMVDVKHEKCTCGIRAWYGLPGQGACKCAQCKTDGMIPLPTKRCIVKRCREPAVFGTRIHQHCEEHALPTEINLVEHKCIGPCGLVTIVSPTSKMCIYCDPQPDPLIKEASRPQKTRELAVKALLERNGYEFVHDRRIEDGRECRLLDRPDFQLDFGFADLFLEVDENRHENQARQCTRRCDCPAGAPRHCKCEQARMHDVSQANGKPCIWIRFNPDSYKMNNGARGKVGIAARHEELIRVLKAIKEAGPDGLRAYAEVIYMYYGGASEIEREVLVGL
jgi:hypothetical protein